MANSAESSLSIGNDIKSFFRSSNTLWRQERSRTFWAPSQRVQWDQTGKGRLGISQVRWRNYTLENMRTRSELVVLVVKPALQTKITLTRKSFLVDMSTHSPKVEPLLQFWNFSYKKWCVWIMSTSESNPQMCQPGGTHPASPGALHNASVLL